MTLRSSPNMGRLLIMVITDIRTLHVEWLWLYWEFYPCFGQSRKAVTYMMRCCLAIFFTRVAIMPWQANILGPVAISLFDGSFLCCTSCCYLTQFRNFSVIDRSFANPMVPWLDSSLDGIFFFCFPGHGPYENENKIQDPMYEPPSRDLNA